MKILVTAFDPFGGESVNAAEEALGLLPGRLDGVEIVKLTVPTVFDVCVGTAARAVEEFEPGAVLCLGQAAGRRALTPERVAINIDDARIADNAGERPVDRAIDPAGPAAYFSTLPVKEMVSAIHLAGVPAEVSNTAGTFVCNHLMYGLLRWLDVTGRDTPAGFMHVPGTGALPPEVCAEGVAAAVRAIGRRLCK